MLVARGGKAGAQEPAITVRRAGAAIRVECHSTLDRGGAEQLRSVLLDLIDGQGNLTIDVVLRETAVVDLALRDVLVTAEERLSSRAGHFSVVTPNGCWSPTGG